MTRAIVLLGPPGAGKSTAGRAAAERLGLSFFDLDDEIARLRDRPLAEVFAEGEAAFRALELFVLPALLRAADVIAAGAGVVDGARARALLASRRCVLLDVSAEVGLVRVGGDRPWLTGVEDPLSTYRAREAGRLVARRALGRTRVDAERPFDGVVADLAAALAALRRA